MFYVRRLRVLLPVLLLALPLYAQQHDLTDTDRAAIRTVIERQLDALRQDDAASAFALASPEIQAKFETPERFLTMVRTSYQPVYRPRQVVFRDLNARGATYTGCAARRTRRGSRSGSLPHAAAA